MMPQNTILQTIPVAAAPRLVPEPDTRRRARRALEHTVHHCHRVAQTTIELANLAPQRAALEAERTTLPSHAGLWTLLAVFVLLAAGAMETVVSGSVLEYFAGQQLHLSEHARERVRWLAPWLVLALEAMLAVRIAHDRRERLPGERGASAALRLAVGLVAVLLCMTFTTSMARWPDNPEAHDLAMLLLKAGSAMLLTAVVHAIVLYSGPVFETAWTYAGYNARAARNNSAERREEAALEGARTAARGNFDIYYHDREDYNRRHPAYAIAPGPFDAITSRVINEIYGREMVSTAPGSGDAAGHGNGAPAPPAPAPAEPRPKLGAPPAAPAGPGASPESGESDYLRHALDRMVRDRDGELGPEPPAAPTN